MTVPLARLDVARVEEQAIERVQRQGRAWVVAPGGTGGTQLADNLQARIPNAVRLDLRDPAEEDALTHLVFSMTPLMESAEERSRAVDELARSAQVDSIVTLLVERLRSLDRHLIVSLAGPWRTSTSSDDWSQRRYVLGDRLLRTLWSTPEIRMVGLSQHKHQLADEALRLRPPDVNIEALFDEEQWGCYAAHAAELGHEVGDGGGLMPVPVRLAVGALAMGARLGDVVRATQEPARDAVPLLVRLIASAPKFGDVRRAVSRMLCVRTTVEPDDVVRWTRVPDEHAPLLTTCLGYGVPVRISQDVRARMSPQMDLSLAEKQKDHAELGDRHAERDGAIAPPLGDAGSLRAWLEKAHHYAHAGSERATEWAALDHATPELYWARGRALSAEERWSEAAEVYESCAKRFPDDDYAWHYHGYNLARIEARRTEAEPSLRRAVRLSPTNPWWNSRLITYLISDGAFDLAHEQWNRSLPVVEPPQGQPDGWLFGHFHRRVAREWLDADQPADAKRIMSAVPVELPELEAEASQRLADLRAAIEHALEEQKLGFSVYPPSVPIDARWRTEPDLLEPFIDDGVDLEEWFVGQIVETEPSGVKIAYASTRDPPDRRAIRFTHIAAQEWRSMGAWWKAMPGQFVELGRYADGTRRVARRPQ